MKNDLTDIQDQEVVYNPTEKQQKLHETSVREPIPVIASFGGASGPGKTTAIVMDAYQHAQVNRNARVLLVSPTSSRGLIEESKKFYFKRDEGNPTRGTYYAKDRTWYFKNGSSIEITSWSHMEKFRTFEELSYSYIGFDEAQRIPNAALHFMVSRLRTTRPIRCVMRLTLGGSEQGLTTHLFLKTINLPYEFIPANLADNEHLDSGDKAYRRNLESLPLEHRGFMLEGFDGS